VTLSKDDVGRTAQVKTEHGELTLAYYEAGEPAASAAGFPW
jgi:hypothetical protein